MDDERRLETTEAIIWAFIIFVLGWGLGYMHHFLSAE